MRIVRTIPPAAAPMSVQDIVRAAQGIWYGERAIRRLQGELKTHFGCRYCFLTSSGKAAFVVILRALKELFPEREEVIVPSFTCYSVPSSIVRAGLTTSIWDVCPDTLDFDYNRMPASLKRTAQRDFQPPLCVVPTHLFGIPVNMERLRDTLRKTDIPVVEDAAQAMGGEWRGQKLGTLGDVGFFSLGRGKAISTGEGGIILTDNPDIGKGLQKQLDQMPGYGTLAIMKLLCIVLAMIVFLRPILFWIPKSLPFLKLGETVYDPDFEVKRMHPSQAGMARGWRARLASFQTMRSKNTRRWVEQLRPKHARLLLSIGEEIAPLIRFPILVDDPVKRSKLLSECEHAGLGVMPSYPESIAKLRQAGLDCTGDEFRGGEELAAGLVTLPVHPFLSSADARRIEQLIRNII